MLTVHSEKLRAFIDQTASLHHRTRALADHFLGEAPELKETSNSCGQSFCAGFVGELATHMHQLQTLLDCVRADVNRLEVVVGLNQLDDPKDDRPMAGVAISGQTPHNGPYGRIGLGPVRARDFSSTQG